MDVREKLVELIYENSPRLVEEEAEILANRLITNGVTIQEWISVKDRLPDNDGDYLCYKKSGLYEVFRFAKDGRKIHKYDFFRDWKNVWFFYDSEYGYVTTDSVTHWMPLPEPPKGE